MWNVKLGKPGGGEIQVQISATDESKMKNAVRAQYPGHQLRNYSRA